MGKKIEIAGPSELFKPFIKYYKYIESDITGILKVVPLTYVELYFNFTHINLFSPGYFDLDNPLVHLAGLQEYEQNIFTHMYGTDRNGGFAIVFQPQGFYHLFNVKSSDFYKYCINGESIFKNDIYHLWEQLEAFDNVIDMKNLFECYLSKCAKQSSCRFDLINNIISYMDNSNGMTRVSQICDIFNVTPRSLDRHFKDEIGISPKELLNIFRINKAIRLIFDNPDCDLTRISYLSGYYDQSHFIKEIKKITGISPRHLQERGTIKNAIHHNILFIKKN
jgi:AraC-like DNA-binding protein